MRIAYVCADRGVRPSGRSGSATHVRELIRALVARGHDVTLLCTAAETSSASLPCRVISFDEEATGSKVGSHIYKAARTLGDTSRATREVQELLLNSALTTALSGMQPQPDLVYERQSLWCFAGLEFAKRVGAPHLLEVNAPLVDQQREFRELDLLSVAAGVESLLLSGSDRVLVTSPGLIPYARERGASGRRVRVVTCGVPATILNGGARSGASRDAPFVVGFLGTLKPWHGIDILLRAFRKLHRRSRDFRLLVIGDGPERARIETYLKAHNLEPYSEMPGEIEASGVPAQLARMSVGVAPYPDATPFYFSPLKLWEYAGAGVPIVASSAGDLPELFPHREAALLHPPGSSSRLAEHIAKLHDDPQLAQRLARRARQIARAHTWDRIAARVEKIANTAIAEVRARR
jgi:glycosyltransferase involved in cell wall biosynthesis